MKQRVLVCGGRGYDNRKLLFDVLDVAHAANPIELLIHGDATGADAMAHEWAQDKGLVCSEFRAAWREHGKAAGPMRNQRMLDEGKPHLVIAFPGGRGTNDMIQKAYSAKVPVVQVRG
jgi:hypothetical protein